MLFCLNSKTFQNCSNKWLALIALIKMNSFFENFKITAQIVLFKPWKAPKLKNDIFLPWMFVLLFRKSWNLENFIINFVFGVKTDFFVK